MGFNFTENQQAAGSLAILSDPANIAENSPWYLINQIGQNGQYGFRFACAAILAPKPRTVLAGGTFDLTYRIVVGKTPWTSETLSAASTAWVKNLPAAAQQRY